MQRRQGNPDRGDDILGLERLVEIDWAHPEFSGLSDAARLIYACYVDRCSAQAVETIAAVDLVWRHREGFRRRAASSAERLAALDEICLAVQELVDRGLLLFDERSSLDRAWARRPWETPS